MSAPTFTLRFRVWLTTTWCDSRRAVFLNDHLSVIDAFNSIDTKMSKVLDGKEIVGLRLWLGDPQAQDGKYIDIDNEDEDGWETILEYVKDAGVAEMQGTVMRQN